MTTLDRSLGTGVPPGRGDSNSTAVEEILENPGRGAGELPAEVPDGEELPVAGAGSVMKPVESICVVAFSAFFFLFFFSVLPLLSGCGSRNSEA